MAVLPRGTLKLYLWIWRYMSIALTDLKWSSCPLLKWLTSLTLPDARKYCFDNVHQMQVEVVFISITTLRFQGGFLSESSLTCRITIISLTDLSTVYGWSYFRDVTKLFSSCTVSLLVCFWHERMGVFRRTASVYTLQSVRQKNRDDDRPSIIVKQEIS